MRRLADEHGVAVTGRVDDVRPYMHDAAVYVVPLRIGGGTRLKIFEAMAMGKAVVSTTVGAEGLPVDDGEHVAARRRAARRSPDAVVRLLRDGERRGARSKRPPGRWSSSATTGRPWRARWKRRSIAVRAAAPQRDPGQRRRHATARNVAQRSGTHRVAGDR